MLTYIQINADKPREKAWTLSDSQSLYLVIQPNGSKLWRFNYRFLDKQKKLHLGGWPTISLAEARVRRDEAKKIAEGIDPALEKKRARIAAKYAAANLSRRWRRNGSSIRARRPRARDYQQDSLVACQGLYDRTDDRARRPGNGRDVAQ